MGKEKKPASENEKLFWFRLKSELHHDCASKIELRENTRKFTEFENQKIPEIEGYNLEDLRQ